jgi:hypothetical protein
MNFHQFQQAMLAAIDLAQQSDQISTVSFDLTDHDDQDEDGEDQEPTDDEDDDYNNAPVYPMPFFRPDDKPDETDEDLKPNQDDDDQEPNLEDLEPSDDFGGSFPLSVEYDDDQLEPTYIDHDHDNWL